MVNYTVLERCWTPGDGTFVRKGDRRGTLEEALNWAPCTVVASRSSSVQKVEEFGVRADLDDGSAVEVWLEGFCSRMLRDYRSLFGDRGGAPADRYPMSWVKQLPDERRTFIEEAKKLLSAKGVTL